MATEHNHTSLGRYSSCPACQNREPDVEDPTAPPGCTYIRKETPIDILYVCRRHGYVAQENKMGSAEEVAAHYETYTGPCVARKKED